MKRLPQNMLTIAYFTALSIIAIISIESYFRVNDALHLQRKSAMIINMSGRQRMWSQRIASLAEQYAGGDRAARPALLDAVHEFETAHRRLILGDTALQIPAMNARSHDQIDELRDIYFNGTHPLDVEVGGYIRHAKHLANAEPRSDEANADLLPILIAARSPLLTDLNNAVTVYNKISDTQVDHLMRLQLLALMIVIFALLSEALGIFRPLVRNIAKSHEELLRLAMIDPLTDVYNRRSFFDRCCTELARARRYRQPTCVLVIDLDRFKAINDTYGHGGGDEVLKAFCHHLKTTLRPSETIGRLGGEEFAICLADTGLGDASIVADRIRREIANLTVVSGSDTIKFSISIGVAQFDPAATEPTVAINLADKALYDAKRSGGNMVMTSILPKERGAQRQSVSIGFNPQNNMPALSDLVDQA